MWPTTAEVESKSVPNLIKKEKDKEGGGCCIRSLKLLLSTIAWKSQRRHIYPLSAPGSSDKIYQVLLFLSTFSICF